MNSPAKTPEAPDMSAMKHQLNQKKKQKAPAAMVQKPEPKDPAVIEKLNTLSEEEKVQLDMVLSPSLATILKKIFHLMLVSNRSIYKSQKKMLYYQYQ